MSTEPVNFADAQAEVEPPPTCLENMKGDSLATSEPPINEEGEDSGGEKDEEDSIPTPTLLSMRSSATPCSSSSSSSSPSISPSSSITTDTSVASDTHRGNLGFNKNILEEHKVAEGSAELNNDATVASLDSGKVEADLNRINTMTITNASTSASPTPSTAASSSSASLPPPTPCGSSAPTSTSPSTTNVNDLSVDSNGLMSLLRPRPQLNNQILNVKFAPLPELAPRKRKSNTPLGMAARSQLARRRRMMYQDPYDDDEPEDDPYRARRLPPPKISEEGAVEAGAEQNGTKKKAKKKDAEDDEKKKTKKYGEQEDEDPLAALAKRMGRAGKHLWRRMASGGKFEKDGAEDGKGAVEELGVVAGMTTGGAEHQEREGQEQGVVWIEEVDEKCKKIQEMRALIQIESSLYQAMSTPLPPSTPSSPTDDTPEEAFPPSSQELSQAGLTHGGDSALADKVNSLPTTPSIVISAA